MVWAVPRGALLGRGLGRRDISTVSLGLPAYSWAVPHVNQDQI